MSSYSPSCTTTPEYGQLGSCSLDYIFTEVTDVDLRHIVDAAPASLCTTLSENADRNNLLFHVLKLGGHEAVQQVDHFNRMKALISMSKTDLLHLQFADPDELRSLMESATIADPTLTPSEVPENDSNMMVIATL